MYLTLTSEELEVILNFIHRTFAEATDHAYNERNFNLSFADFIGKILCDFATDESRLFNQIWFSDFDSTAIRFESRLKFWLKTNNELIDFNNRKGDDAFGVEFIRVLREEITMMEWAEKHGNDDYHFSKYHQIVWLCAVIGSNHYKSKEEFYTASMKPEFVEMMKDYVDSPGFEEFVRTNRSAIGYENVMTGGSGEILIDDLFDGVEKITPIIVSRIILGGIR